MLELFPMAMEVRHQPLAMVCKNSLIARISFSWVVLIGSVQLVAEQDCISDYDNF